MFCPKCGTKNPEDGKFCRSCGSDLAVVNAALTGGLAINSGDPGKDAGLAYIQNEAKRRKDPTEIYGDSIKAIITGAGFLIVSIVLFTTGVAGGKAWWWAMLFPAFTFLAKGISDLLKSRRMVPPHLAPRPPLETMPPTALGSTRSENLLPPQQTNFVAPESRYRTGDLAPPSVTDDTTRHLEMQSEGETMALPKK